MSLVENYYQITIASHPENIVELEEFIEQIREEQEVSSEAYGNILIGITEAVNNCMFHGNLLDKSKNVRVTCTRENDELVFVASDEGVGFKYNDLPDPTSPENIEKTTGRGVFLMKQLADGLLYTDNGATVEMRFKL